MMLVIVRNYIKMSTESSNDALNGLVRVSELSVVQLSRNKQHSVTRIESD